MFVVRRGTELGFVVWDTRKGTELVFVVKDERGRTKMDLVFVLPSCKDRKRSGSL